MILAKIHLFGVQSIDIERSSKRAVKTAYVAKEMVPPLLMKTICAVGVGRYMRRGRSWRIETLIIDDNSKSCLTSFFNLTRCGDGLKDGGGSTEQRFYEIKRPGRSLFPIENV